MYDERRDQTPVATCCMRCRRGEERREEAARDWMESCSEQVATGVSASAWSGSDLTADGQEARSQSRRGEKEEMRETRPDLREERRANE